MKNDSLYPYFVTVVFLVAAGIAAYHDNNKTCEIVSYDARSLERCLDNKHQYLQELVPHLEQHK
jgi:hypothetical protein